MVDSDFNVDLADPEGSACAEEIVTALAIAGLEDTITHFFPRHKYWSRDGHTWNIRRNDRMVCS